MQVFSDTWLLFKYHFKLTGRNPALVIVGLFQPLCHLFLFAPLLLPLADHPRFPRGGAYTIFTPGLLVMLGITGTLFVGFGFLADLRAGVLERMRVTPISRLALVLGRSMRDVATFLIQSVVLLVSAWWMGLSANAVGLAITLVLLVLISLTISSFSYAVALAIKDENTFSAILNFLIMPLLLLSGITLPLVLAPDWLRQLSSFNPFAYAVEAGRALLIGNFADSSIVLSFGIMALLTAITLTWAVRAFRQGMG
jgi:ABC-2 type transport system permease protein